jgi:hypothetical protein
MEECSEVAKVTSKSLRFGTDHCLEGKPYANSELLVCEIMDLYAMIEMLNDEGIIELDHYNLIDEKKERVEKFLLLSKERGHLEDGTK